MSLGGLGRVTVKAYNNDLQTNISAPISNGKFTASICSSRSIRNQYYVYPTPTPIPRFTYCACRRGHRYMTPTSTIHRSVQYIQCSALISQTCCSLSLPSWQCVPHASSTFHCVIGKLVPQYTISASWPSRAKYSCGMPPNVCPVGD